MEKETSLRGLGLRDSLLLFLLPGIFFALLLHLALPAVSGSGVPRWIVREGIFFLMYSLAYALSYFLLRAEGLDAGRAEFLKRIRLGRLSRSDALWSLVLLAAFVLGFLLADSAVKGLFAEAPGEASAPGTHYGLELRGAYWYLPFSILLLLYGVAAEELVWRGVILPRQEARLGGYAFVVNGLLWAAFHMGMPLIALALIPSALALAWVSQRTKSLWPAFLVHLVFNCVGASETWIAVFAR